MQKPDQNTIEGEKMNVAPIKAANITLSILLAIALLPALALSEIQQAWAETNDEGVYALYYRDTDSNTYTLVIQNSDEDYSQGAYGELDPTKTYAICSDAGCKCDEWNNTSLSGGIVKVVTQKVENGKVSTYGKLPAIHSMDSWFRGLRKCESIDLKALNTSQVTYMVRAFMNCSSLTEIELGYLDTSNVVLMTAMFEGCSSLRYFDSLIDTSKVEYMGSMFSGCSSMTSADLSSFDTSNLQNMSSMFYDCQSLRTVDLSSFDTTQSSDVEDLAGGLFENCFHLSKVILGERSALGRLLPTPSSQYIENATGSWKNERGQVFTTANIPVYTQGTYTAEIAQGNTSTKPTPVNPPTTTKPSTPQTVSLAKASAETTIDSATYYGRPLCPGSLLS